MRKSALVRDLARRGELAERAGAVSGSEYAELSGGAYDIVWHLVFQRTRTFEIRRGHFACATSVQRLEPECLDRFQDDVEAVLEDLLRNATVPIANLEGWIAKRLKAATVNAHRRRRGERGALQRPRMPGWLANALDNDVWLTALAIEILVWVGLPITAGGNVWPLNGWADLRAKITGDFRVSEAELVKDIETVLAAMRQRHTWYANFVERPLGRKQAPVLPALNPDADHSRERPPLALTEQHESDDARLLELAATAITAIEVRLKRGQDPRSAVTDVLGAVFGAGTGAEVMDREPGAAPATDEPVAALTDPARFERILAEILDILGGGAAR